MSSGNARKPVVPDRLRNVNTLAAPLLPRGGRRRVEHARVHREHGIQKVDAVRGEERLVIAAEIGEPVLRTPWPHVAGGVPEHAVEFRRKRAARRGGHQVQIVVIVLGDVVRDSVRAVQRNRSALPEVVPPLGVVAGEVVEAFRGSGVEVARLRQRPHPGRHSSVAALAIRMTTRPRSAGETMRTSVSLANRVSVLPTEQSDGHRRFRSMGAFFEVLRQQNAAVSRGDL